MKVKPQSYLKQYYLVVITLSLALLIVINIVLQNAIASKFAISLK